MFPVGVSEVCGRGRGSSRLSVLEMESAWNLTTQQVSFQASFSVTSFGGGGGISTFVVASCSSYYTMGNGKTRNEGNGNGETEMEMEMGRGRKSLISGQKLTRTQTPNPGLHVAPTHTSNFDKYTVGVASHFVSAC